MEANVRALAQEVQWLGHECDEGNRNVVLLEDVLEPEGGETGTSLNFPSGKFSHAVMLLNSTSSLIIYIYF